MPAAERVLLVADSEADAPQLLAVLRQLVPGAPSVSVLFPAYATPAVAGVAWAAAADRVERCAARLRLAGVELEEAIVGDPDPILAADDAHHSRAYDLVVFVTPAAGRRGAFAHHG